MFGTLINVAAIVAGGLLGLMLKGKLHQKYSHIIVCAIGLMTIVLGVSMAIRTDRVLVVVASLVVGSLVGEWIALDKAFDKLAAATQRLTRSTKQGSIIQDTFIEGFVTSTLLFCVGSMAILGPIQEATGAEPSILHTKSMMDGVSAMFFAASLGVGVLFSSIPVLIYQGTIAICAGFVVSYLSDAVVTDLTATGGVLLLGLGISILKIKQVNVINMLPSLVVAVIFSMLYS